MTDIDIVDDILEGLGPRYSDWAGGKPVPIDGDLLLGSDTVFKKPFRLLPYGMKPGLSPVEITELRHLVRHLPPHFVLGQFPNSFMLFRLLIIRESDCHQTLRRIYGSYGDIFWKNNNYQHYCVMGKVVIF